MGVKVRERAGKFYVFIHHKGRRKAKCVGDERAAEKAARAIRERLALGDLGILFRDEHPFERYYQEWLDSYVVSHCKRSTYDGYEASGRLYFVPAFGSKDIADIERSEVRALAYRLLRAKGLKRVTVRSHLAPLHAMFEQAKDDGLIASNPAARILGRSRKDAGDRRAPEAEFLTRDEVAALLGASRRAYPRWYPFVLLLARTGMRLGEALGLEWDAIDFRARFAVVRQSLVEGRVEVPKSGKTRRVDLSRHLTDTLRLLRREQRKASLRRGEPAPTRLFAGVDADNFRRREWRRMLAEAELRRVPIKALRHTFASLLLAQGESLAYVRDQMGHHSIQITVDHYGHLVPGGNRAAVDRLDDPAPAQQSATHAQPASGGAS